MSDQRDRDLMLNQAIERTRGELNQAREVVRNLANELADVIEVVEPALTAHSTRLRQVRMSSINEMREISGQLKTLTDLLLAEKTERMLKQAERFLVVCRELEEFRAVGFLDAFVQLFATYERQ